MRKILICLILMVGVLTSCSIVDSKEAEKVVSNNPKIKSTLKEGDKSKYESDLNNSDDNSIVNNDISEGSSPVQIKILIMKIHKTPHLIQKKIRKIKIVMIAYTKVQMNKQLKINTI